MRHKAPVGHGKRGPTPGSPLEGDRGRPRAARRQRSTRGPGRVHRSQPGCRASPNKPEAGKTARRTDHAGRKAGRAYGTPSGARPAAIHGRVRGGREPGVTRTPGLARPRDRDAPPLLGGPRRWATKAWCRPTTSGPNPDGGPAGHNRPAGSSLKAPPGKRPLMRRGARRPGWGEQVPGNHNQHALVPSDLTH